MKRRGHVVAMLLCAILALVLLASLALEVHEHAHPHSCAGAACPVCRLMIQIKRLRAGLTPLAAAMVCALLARLTHECVSRGLLRPGH